MKFLIMVIISFLGLGMKCSQDNCNIYKLSLDGYLNSPDSVKYNLFISDTVILPDEFFVDSSLINNYHLKNFNEKKIYWPLIKKLKNFTITDSVKPCFKQLKLDPSKAISVKIYFSPIIFSETKNKAVFFRKVTANFLSSSEVIFLLEKKENWKIVRQILLVGS